MSGTERLVSAGDGKDEMGLPRREAYGKGKGVRTTHNEIDLFHSWTSRLLDLLSS